MAARTTFDPMGLDKNPNHSLLENPIVLDLVMDINDLQAKIALKRHPKKELSDDGYLRLYEGPALRTSVIVQFILDYFCKNPKLLLQEIARREKESEKPKAKRK